MNENSFLECNLKLIILESVLERIVAGEPAVGLLHVILFQFSVEISGIELS